MVQDSTPYDAGSALSSAADRIFGEWQGIWTNLQQAIDGWASQDVIATNRGQRSAEWAASAGELSGRLAYLWTRGALNLSQVYGDVAMEGLKSARNNLR